MVSLGATMVRYAICGVILCAVVGGAYYLGYSSGADNTRVEYVEKTVEVIKHVEVERGKIYSAPNANRVQLLDFMHKDEL